MKKEIKLRDNKNKNKTLTIGEPFLPDGTFWAVSRFGKEVVFTIKLNNNEVAALAKFLFDYGNRKKSKI